MRWALGAMRQGLFFDRGNCMEINDVDIGALTHATRQRARWRLGLRADLADISDTVLQLKMFQSLDASPASFPIYRLIRFAVRRALEELFDVLALHHGWSSQRFEAGKILLQGAGFLVLADARRKLDYSSGKFAIWADGVGRADEVRERLLGLVGEQLVRDQTFTIDWRFHSKSEGSSSVSFDEIADAELLDDAYPYIAGGVSRFTEAYLDAPETVLILQGPPGTGKTRLVRSILAAISQRKGDSARVLFTSDRRTLESDELFVDFLTGEHDAFFVEDADHLLDARSNGNTELHRFLTIADGVVRAQGRKIIFTTNLPNVNDIDEALLRPGRAFAAVQARALTFAEVSALLRSLVPAEPQRAGVEVALLRTGKRSITLAEVYQAVKRGR
jgi:hypothetical protein